MAKTARISGDGDTATIDDERKQARGAAVQLGEQVGQITDSNLVVDEESEQDRFFAEIDEAASASLVHVYLIQADGDEPKVWKGPPDKFNMEAVARNFGSGKYRVVLYAPHESGRLVKRIGKIVSHLLSPDEERDLRRRRDGRDDNANGGGISEARIVELIRAAQPQPQANPLQQFKEFAEVMRSVMPQPVAVAPVDSFAMVRNVLGLVKDMQPEAPLEKGAGLGDIALRLMEKFGPQIAAAVAQPVPNGAPPALTTQPALAAPANSQPAVESDEMQKLKFGLQFLCDQAKNGKDASLYADVVVDNVPVDSLKGLMSAPDFVGFLAQYHPPVAQYRSWFDSLKQHVSESLAEDAPGT